MRTANKDMVTRLPALLILLLVWLPAPANPFLHGTVVQISNGDTFKVLAEGRTLKIRLAGIDAPEKKQPYGNRARKALARLIFRKEVTILKTDFDRHGTITAKVFFGGFDAGVDVSVEMVRQGLAWVAWNGDRDANLVKLEREARETKRGLWKSQRQPMTSEATIRELLKRS